MGLIDDLKYKFEDGNLAVKLIFINIGVFILVALGEMLLSFIPFVGWLGLINHWTEFITRPWTLFTYMFLHIRAMHLLFNMLMLWIVADFFYRNFGDREFAKFYFFGGIFGGLLYLLFSSVYPETSVLMGASAAIYSVLFAMVAYHPEMNVRLPFINQPIKLLHLAIGFIVLGFLLNTDNLGGNISHVGGALFGYFYMKRFEKGGAAFNSNNPVFNIFKKKERPDDLQDDIPPRDDFEYNEWRASKEDQTNRILEKISRSGYNSLTEEEKEFLFKQGKGRSKNKLCHL